MDLHLKFTAHTINPLDWGTNYLYLDIDARNNPYFRNESIYSREEAAAYLNDLKEKQSSETELWNQTTELDKIWHNLSSFSNSIIKTQPDLAQFLNTEIERISTIKKSLCHLLTKTDINLVEAIDVMEKVMCFFSKKSNQNYMYIFIEND